MTVLAAAEYGPPGWVFVALIVLALLLGGYLLATRPRR